MLIAAFKHQNKAIIRMKIASIVTSFSFVYSINIDKIFAVVNVFIEK